MYRSIEYVVVILMIISYVPYIKGIWKGVIIPQISTWMCWTILDFLLIAAMLQKGVMNGSVIAATLGAIAITTITFFKGKNGWSQIDTLCCVGAVIGVALWKVTDPFWGMVSFLGAISIAAGPTIHKAWIDPEKERKALFSWSLRTSGCLLSLANVRAWTVAGVLQPLVFSLIMGTISLLLLRRRKTQ